MPRIPSTINGVTIEFAGGAVNNVDQSNVGGKPASEIMIISGYAVPYDVGKREKDWCN